MQDRDDLSDSEGFPDPEIDAPGHDAIITLAVFAEGGLAPLSLLLGWLLGHPPLRLFSWDPRGALLGAAAALPPVLGLIALLRRPFGPFVRVKRFFVTEFVPLLGNSTWPDLVLIAVAAGVGEEMLFRGVFQSSLVDAIGTTPGVVLASLLFGVLHPISIPFAVINFTMGLYLGALYLFTGNLLAAMACNGTYNFILMAHLLRPGDPHRPHKNPIEAIDYDRAIDDHDAP